MRIAFVFMAGALLAVMATGSLACERNGGTQFPLRIEAGKNYPTDKEGRPFFMQGDSPWSLIGDLTEEDAYLYLEDRKARGFNTVLVNLLEHRFSRNAPANAYGEKHSPTTAILLLRTRRILLMPTAFCRRHATLVS